MSEGRAGQEIEPVRIRRSQHGAEVAIRYGEGLCKTVVEGQISLIVVPHGAGAIGVIHLHEAVILTVMELEVTSGPLMIRIHSAVLCLVEGRDRRLIAGGIAGRRGEAVGIVA